MQLKKLLKKRDLNSLRIKTPFLEMDWQPNDKDKTAAWKLYVELITRAATQGLDPDEGNEAAALKSIYDLFPLTRETIKRGGRYCINFTRIAVVVLNQIVRPFHRQVASARSSPSLRKPDGNMLSSQHRIFVSRGSSTAGTRA